MGFTRRIILPSELLVRSEHCVEMGGTESGCIGVLIMELFETIQGLGVRS